MDITFLHEAVHDSCLLHECHCNSLYVKLDVNFIGLFLMNYNRKYPSVTSRGQNPLKQYLGDVLDGHLFILDGKLSKLLLDLNV